MHCFNTPGAARRCLLPPLAGSQCVLHCAVCMSIALPAALVAATWVNAGDNQRCRIGVHKWASTHRQINQFALNRAGHGCCVGVLQCALLLCWAKASLSERSGCAANRRDAGPHVSRKRTSYWTRVIHHNLMVCDQHQLVSVTCVIWHDCRAVNDHLKEAVPHCVLADTVRHCQPRPCTAADSSCQAVMLNRETCATFCIPSVTGLC
jgi:hypothetical protein